MMQMFIHQTKLRAGVFNLTLPSNVFKLNSIKQRFFSVSSPKKMDNEDSENEQRNQLDRNDSDTRSVTSNTDTVNPTGHPINPQTPTGAGPTPPVANVPTGAGPTSTVANVPTGAGPVPPVDEVPGLIKSFPDYTNEFFSNLTNKINELPKSEAKRVYNEVNQEIVAEWDRNKKARLDYYEHNKTKAKDLDPAARQEYLEELETTHKETFSDSQNVAAGKLEELYENAQNSKHGLSEQDLDNSGGQGPSKYDCTTAAPDTPSDTGLSGAHTPKSITQDELDRSRLPLDTTVSPRAGTPALPTQDELDVGRTAHHEVPETYTDEDLYGFPPQYTDNRPESSEEDNGPEPSEEDNGPESSEEGNGPESSEGGPSPEGGNGPLSLERVGTNDPSSSVAGTEENNIYYIEDILIFDYFDLINNLIYYVLNSLFI